MVETAKLMLNACPDRAVLGCAPRLDMPGMEAAHALCSCVFECNVPLLRRYLRAGIAVNAANFDARTALHIAAAEGNLAAVRSSFFRGF